MLAYFYQNILLALFMAWYYILSVEMAGLCINSLKPYTSSQHVNVNINQYPNLNLKVIILLKCMANAEEHAYLNILKYQPLKKSI